MKLSSALLLLSAIVAPISAELFLNDPNSSPRLMNITVDVTFPDDAPAEAAPEGSTTGPVIVVNGIPKKINVAIVNHEQETLGISFLGGSLWDPVTGANVRNLTQQVLSVELETGQQADLPYVVLVDMHPKELLLKLQMVLRAPDQKLVTATAYNSNISIVEQPMSLLDPQLLFLYLVLLSGVAGAGYWAYNYWLDTVNPKRKRGNRQPVKTTRAESPVAAATGVEGKKFDESWIPEHHIKRATSPKARGKTNK